MMHHGLNALAVFSHALSHELAVTEIITDAIPRKDFRCHQPRVNIAAVVPEHEFVKSRLMRGPIFLRRHNDRFPRPSRWSAKNKRMDALAIDHLHVRQLT